jgi:glutamyl-tRNA synthetase
MANEKKVRVRFAPSPTGGLHLGGVRTAFFNYLFAKKNKGTFILRIEDTDQNRFVEGAEEYINNCLAWCGIEPDESPIKGGEYGPYRQSERKESYRQYAEQLVEKGFAYYAFDTPEELQKQRELTPNFKYNHENRLRLRNSLSLTEQEVAAMLAEGVPHVIRLKVIPEEHVSLHDMIRGTVSFETSLVDDKVLLKADGMPTYHLAVVVDDYKMKITHVFRGEEWLPSAPIHVLLWEYLGWSAHVPEWVHLPLILKPDGNGKLSKRDGERLGFPVFAMNWKDATNTELVKGFREMGFLPEAFINMLALLGWNDGTEKEIFTKNELIEAFSLERVSKAGAKFDFEKAKWFNHEWIKKMPAEELIPHISPILANHEIYNIDRHYLTKVINLVKERLTFIEEFWEHSAFFFKRPEEYDIASIKSKWNEDKTNFFTNLMEQLKGYQPWTAENLEVFYKLAIEASGMKMGELMLPLRIMLVGGKFGPHVFDIAAVLGREESIERIKMGLAEIVK